MLHYKRIWPRTFFVCVLGIGLFGVLGNGYAGAAEKAPSTKGLEKLVAQWVELRHQISLEKNAWEQDSQRLTQEKQLLEKEISLLRREIAKLTKNSQGQSAQQLRLLEEKKNSETALQALRGPIKMAEEKLLLWEKRLPTSLAKPLENHFQKINDSAGKNSSRRLQTILTLYAQIEIYQNTIQTGKEILAVAPGKDVEMDVLYIGLVRGFCISRDGRLAGVASPTTMGWSWQWRPELASEIQLAFDYYAHRKIADYISLPMAITGERP